MDLIARAKSMMRDPKERVATISVLAAVFLVLTKLIVGLVTNSLGILSEALHSGLDLVAAVITCFAVVSSNKPPDEEHQFGHGKFENFSALVETLLLLATCVWIIVEAVHRLRYHGEARVSANWYGFAVMGLSIVIDTWRSRALYRAARRHNSQALEADALHFASDIYSSLVVIAGLGFVYLGFPLADPIAAIGVAIFVAIATFRLGRRTAQALIDKAPRGLSDDIRAKVDSVDGVRCERVRTRLSGPSAFVDLVVSMDRTMGLELSHEITTEVKAKVREVLPGADVLIHVNPRATPEEDLPSRIRLIAQREREITGLHRIEVRRIGQSTVVDLHVELTADIRVKEAHELVSRFEERIERELGVDEVNTHIETHSEVQAGGEDVTEDHAGIASQVEQIAARFGALKDCHHVVVRRVEGQLCVNMHCGIADTETVGRAHELSTGLEAAIRAEIKGLGPITIHIEPA